MSKLEIEIPTGKEIDWETSAKRKQIVFKDKQLTYENICTQIFASGCWYLDSSGNISYTKHPSDAKNDPNNATTQHQLECILAKNKLANVARYLNGDWDYYHSSNKFIIWINTNTNDKLEISDSGYLTQRATVIFKSRELAKQAIEILGEEEVKLALEPLY